jgi:phytoene dehydrogenase-like protein
MHYDTVVVGAGIAGLTASAFLSKSGRSVLLLEKQEKVGGLINSFKREGFTFDGGIRAIENSGVLFPMLRQLGIEIELIKNNISIGIEDDIIQLESVDSLIDYQDLLKKCFPADSSGIEKLISETRKIISYMDVLYGIDNPVFLDMKKDRKYFMKVILPWMFKYMMTIKKIEKLKTPIRKYLESFTSNPSLIDIIAQHFFRNTPAFFALGYLKLYLDYFYPRGGTQVLTEKLEEYILDHGGSIKTNAEIKEVEPFLHKVTDKKGGSHTYEKLIWAADLKSLYEITNTDSIKDNETRSNIRSKQKSMTDKTGGDSVFTLYLCIDLDKKYFSDISSEHFFYTPYSKGLSQAGNIKSSDKKDITEWLGEYFKLNTYEIACPVLRDDSLAPDGKTGLIISTLFDYSITKKIFDMGWYDEFKVLSENMILNTLEKTIYPGIKNKITCQFSSTPLTLFRRYGNSDGAITGWAFTNEEIPVETRLPRIASSTRTPIPDILQAGQWSFSPSGLPISILTGKMASDQILKQFK